MKFTALLAGCMLALPTALLAAGPTPTTTFGLAERSVDDLLVEPLKFEGLDGDARNYTIQMPDGAAAGTLERRQNAGDIYNSVTALLNDVASWANNQGGSGNDKRSRFTQEFVSQANRRWTRFNWVICHTDHSTWWQGTYRSDWDWQPYNLPATGHRFAVNWARAGTFQRRGDGGFLNWAWVGWPTYVSPGGDLIEFRAP